MLLELEVELGPGALFCAFLLMSLVREVKVESLSYIWCSVIAIFSLFPIASENFISEAEFLQPNGNVIGADSITPPCDRMAVSFPATSLLFPGVREPPRLGRTGPRFGHTAQSFGYLRLPTSHRVAIR